ncbi:MAG: hypothetical protein GEV03_25510 [Streptosporangiales bacterium]|nr:hypothetical protein [Streptosporangiales bacterium]
MADFRVVPEALRTNVKSLYDAADAWEAAYRALSGKDLAGDDLGRLGRIEDVTRSHNETLRKVLEALREGANTLQQAGDSLNHVAKVYEAKDAEYYRGFGHLA